MGYKDDQTTRLNIKPDDVIKHLRREIIKLNEKIKKLEDDNRTSNANKPNN